MSYAHVEPKEYCPDCDHAAYHHRTLSGCDVATYEPTKPWTYCPCHRVWGTGDVWLVREWSDDDLAVPKEEVAP